MSPYEFTPCNAESAPVGHEQTTYTCERPKPHDGYCQGAIRDQAGHIIGNHLWITPDRLYINIIGGTL